MSTTNNNAAAPSSSFVVVARRGYGRDSEVFNLAVFASREEAVALVARCRASQELREARRVMARQEHQEWLEVNPEPSAEDMSHRAWKEAHSAFTVKERAFLEGVLSKHDVASLWHDECEVHVEEVPSDAEGAFKAWEAFAG